MLEIGDSEILVLSNVLLKRIIVSLQLQAKVVIKKLIQIQKHFKELLDVEFLTGSLLFFTECRCFSVKEESLCATVSFRLVATL